VKHLPRRGMATFALDGPVKERRMDPTIRPEWEVVGETSSRTSNRSRVIRVVLAYGRFTGCFTPRDSRARTCHLATIALAGPLNWAPLGKT